MNCRQRSSSNDGDIINISSMLDVMFILIIFFLVTTTFKEEEIDHMVNLPVDAKNQSLTQSTGNLIKINIRKIIIHRVCRLTLRLGEVPK